MKKYLLILGNCPDLAKEELKSLVKFNELLFKPPVLVIETDELIPVDRLGGTVKLGEVIDNTPGEYLKNLGKTSVDFGFSAYGSRIPDLKSVKTELSAAGIKSRFVVPKEGWELSSVVVKKQKLEEFLFAYGFVAKTLWVQDFEGWNKRDYGRPEVQAHIGMLPPKVARMMINISGAKDTILDPFCGVGTIAMEALELGFNVISSDIDNRQVSRTKTNLEWLGKKAQLFVCDARKISEKVRDVEAIVTEPFLGPNDGRTKDQGLEKLYFDCFLEWKKVLRPGGKVVIVLPGFNLDDSLVKNVIDKARTIGYILCTGPIVYARPQARVIRNICVFQYGTY